MWWARLPSAGTAARHDTVAEDMAVLGVKDFQVPDWMLEEDETDPDEFSVLPENWDAVNAFLACTTQWRHDAAGTPIGLRYDGVEVVLRARRVRNKEDAFMRVQIMETASAKEFAKLAKQARKKAG